MAKSTAVSLTFKGDGSSKATGGDSGGSDKLRKSMEKNAESSQKLSNSIIEGLGLSKLLADIFGGMYKLLSPILRILNVIGILILLPLMPIFKLIAQGLAYFSKLLAPGGGNIVEKIVAWVIAILTVVAGILFLIFGGWLLAILVAIGLLLMVGWKYIATALKWVWDTLLKPVWDVIVFGLQSVWMLFKAVWDGIVFGLQSTWAIMQIAWGFLVNAGKWIWESILKPAFDFLATVGTWIWDSILKPAFDFLKDVGTWIWDILKTPFNALASAISGAISFIRGLFGGGGSSKSSTSQTALKWVWDTLLKPVWDVIVFGLQSVWMLLKAVWDGIVFGLQSTWALLQVAWGFLINAGKWIWESILKPAFDFLATVGTWIWDSILKPAFNFLKDVGTWIWGILKTPFNALASAISGAISFIRGLFGGGGSSKSSTTSKSVKDAIITPQGVVHTDPNDFIIATKNPSALGGNSIKTKSSNTINFNNPVVRNEQDINKIADAVSKILIKAGKNRY